MDTEETTQAVPTEEVGSSLGLSFDPGLFAVPFSALPLGVKTSRAAAGLPCEGVEFKSIRSEVKASTKDRTVELYIAAFDNIDDVGDVIPFGAASKSIATDGAQGQIKFFWQHKLLLGPMAHIEEQSKGIFCAGKVDDDPSLNKYLAHAKSGAAAHGSIGYSTIRSSKTTVNGQPARQLDEIKLWEGSLVIHPANRQATVEAVKAARADLAGKGLYEAAEVIQAMAQIESCTRRIEMLTGEEWAEISAEQREQIDELLDRLTNSEKSLRKGLATADPKTESSIVEVDTASIAAFHRYVDSMKSHHGGQHG